ncbi:oligosaccharide flippase family protein [Microvirga makkahensis]|uniref:Oligosaccharide flippase family protein n=1 Tax=Microvirga makkahensis TaxID=1128670 RepID=A0A7X3MV90_9HYPH|nr:oligosaccharide flippase family protein [Microvirga makkahensis]MXQ13740.1 oligosaccharide flippase family protein [Microvirga makkahensis]
MINDAVAAPLRKRILRASGWTLIQNGASLSLRLFGNLLLTRLLTPEAFGLMAVIQALVVALAHLSDVGISQNIVVHRRGDDPDFLNTVWTVQILRGVLILIASAACAVGIFLLEQAGWFRPGTVYTDPQLPYVIVAFFFYVLILGFETTKVQQARRNMQLEQITMIELMSQAAALIVMLILATTFRNVWALVAGSLVAATLRVVAGHLILSGPRNRIMWDPSAWTDILSFGKWIFLSSVMGFLLVSGDRILLGAIVDSTVLGVYSIAVLLLGVLYSTFYAIIGSVVFPTLSEVFRNHPNDLRQVHRRFQLQADVALFGLAGFLFVAGPAIVDLLYDDRYREAGTMLAALSLGLIGARSSISEQGYLAMGQVRYQAAANFCRVAVLCLGLPLGFALYGIDGALVALILTQYAGWPVTIRFAMRNGLFQPGGLLIGPPLFIAGAALGWLGRSAMLLVMQ